MTFAAKTKRPSLAVYVAVAVGFALVSLGALVFGALYARHERLAGVAYWLGWLSSLVVFAACMWRTLLVRQASENPTRKTNRWVVVVSAATLVLAFDRSPWFTFYLATIGGSLVLAISVLVWRSLRQRLRTQRA